MDNDIWGENNVDNNNLNPTEEKLQNRPRPTFNRAPIRPVDRLRNKTASPQRTLGDKALDKAAERLGNSRLDQKLANKTNHQRPDLGVKNQDDQSKPSNEKNDDIGSRNLQKSLKDKTNKLWKNRKKKKEEKKKEKEQENDSSNTSNDNDDNSTSNETASELRAKVIRRIKIKIIIYASIGFFLLLIFGTIIMAIFGVDISATVPAINQGSYGTDQFAPTYEEGTKEYEEEIKYYEALKKANEEYTNENGEELKTTYIHAVLIYLYYQIDDNTSTDDNIPIEYDKMREKIGTIVELMKPSDSTKTIDYEKNGEFYNKLKNSEDFKKYYEKVLREKPIDELLDEIFTLAEELDELESEDQTVITEETEIAVQTPVSPKKVTITEFLSDSIYAKYTSLDNPELVKAYTIAYSTNIASQNKNLTIDANSASMNNEVCSIKLGCSYKNDLLVDGPGERSDKNTTYYNGAYYYKIPLTSDKQTTLNKNINSVFGNVLVNTDGTYPNLDISKITGLGDGDYNSILTSSYGNYKMKNIGENSYILDASYGEKKVLVDVKFYDQGDYSGNSFCGLKKETIASSGCGITSMAIVVSTYENSNTYTPLWTNDIARKNNHCGAGRGTDYSHFKYVAKQMGYKTPVIYQKSKANGWKLSKSAYNNILKHLSQGHLVIVNVTKGHFTSGGHYMVLGGVDPETKKVYVYDPNNKSNSRYRKTGNGWWSFNDIIAPESKAFIIMEKKG